jgi:Tfp pilus assembly protein PilN
MHDAMLYSGTITKKSQEKALSRLRPDKLFIASVSVPLWDLARLYAQYISGPFIVWKLWRNESILGFVERGRLCRLCNFWAGAIDIARKDTTIGTGLLRLTKSLARSEQQIKIVVCPDGGNPAISGHAVGAPELDFAAPPAIDELPPEFHEAYALALHEETHLDFALLGQAFEARSFARSRVRALRAIRTALVAMLFTAAALFVVKGATLVGEHYVNAKMDPLRRHLTRYKTEQSRLESLRRQMEKKTRFVAQRSALTYPMTELQTAFPEGAWAEEIVFSEGAAESWNFSIIALSNSSNLIPELLKNISSIRGMEAVRMIYSEQTAMKDKAGQRAIKFKIEGNWRKGE